MKTTMKRAVHFDFHTMPKIDDIGGNLDPKEFADMMADAHVDYVNMFARCNIGFSYYPTKVGTVHPNLKFNLLKEQIEAK